MMYASLITDGAGTLEKVTNSMCKTEKLLVVVHANLNVTVDIQYVDGISHL